MNYLNPKKWYNQIEDWISSTILLVALVFLFVQVLGRFIFKWSTPTLEEWSIYIFCWYTFLTSSDALRTNTHIRVELLYNAVNDNVKRWLFLINYVLNLAFCAIFCVSGVQVTLRRIALGTVSATYFPMWIAFACIPVGMFLSTIRCVQQICCCIKYDFMKKPLPDYVNTTTIEIDGVVFEKDAEIVEDVPAEGGEN